MQAILALVLMACPAAAQQKPSAPKFSLTEVQAAMADPQAFMIDPESVKFSRLEVPFRPMGSQADEPAPPPVDPVDPGGSIDPDQIINIYRQIWQIILDNQPVVDVKNSYAAAVPKGVDHWTQLAGWKPPQGTVYAFEANNLYGKAAIRVRYQVMRTAGGSYNGKGKYLTNVTVEPLMVDVSWGYKFSMDAQVAPESIANVGSTEDPIAGMVCGLRWSIHTAVKHVEGKSLYYLQGDGLFQELGGPFKKPYQEEAKRAVEKLQLPVSWN
jgi:hypothetical protein